MCMRSGPAQGEGGASAIEGQDEAGGGDGEPELRVPGRGLDAGGGALGSPAEALSAREEEVAGAGVVLVRLDGRVEVVDRLGLRPGQAVGNPEARGPELPAAAVE